MIKGGPKIIDDSLVLCLDAHDAKSYAGEPTQNYVINTTSTGGWHGDGSSQTGLGSKGAVAITDENLKYNGYDTVLWTPGTSRNCYLNGTEDFNYSETSTEWTFSAYVKYEDGSTISSMSVYMYYPSSDGSSAGTVTDVGGGWCRVRRTRTGSSNYISLAGFDGIAAMKKIYISGWQLEKKQYTTPVTSPATSRSATDGWVDRSGNSNSGTLVNGTNTGINYYRDGQVIMPVSASYLDFDGTDDYVSTSFGDNHNPATNPISYTLWVKTHTNSGNKMFLVQSDWGGNHRAYFGTIGGVCGMGIQSSGWSSSDGGDTITTNTWNHMCIVFEGSTCKWYRNGNLMFSKSYTSFTFRQNLSIGAGRPYSNSYDWNGEIAQVLVNNKLLTAAEVLSNYNATKNRFT